MCRRAEWALKNKRREKVLQKEKKTLKARKNKKEMRQEGKSKTNEAGKQNKR